MLPRVSFNSNAKQGPHIHFSQEPVKRFFPKVIQLWHKLEIVPNISIPSPITHYLMKVLTEEKFNALVELDVNLRAGIYKGDIEYEMLVAYLNAMLLVVEYSIDQYDAIISQLYSSRLTREGYLAVYLDMLSFQSFLHYQCAVALHNEKVRLPPKQASAITSLSKKMKEVFLSADRDFEFLEAQLKSEDGFFAKNASPALLFRICESYLETKLYKTVAFSGCVKNKKNAGEVDRVLDLARAACEKTQDVGVRLSMMDLEIKVTYVYKGDYKKALALLENVMRYLDENYPTPNDAEKAKRVGFIVQKICFMEEQVVFNKSMGDAAMVKQILDTLLTAKPFISFTTSYQKQQLFLTASRFIEANFGCLNHQLQHAKLSDFTALKSAVLSVAPYIQFMPMLNCPEVEKGLALAAKYKGDLSTLYANVRAKHQTMQADLERENQHKKAIEIKQAEYVANFDEIQKQFEQSLKESIRKRPRIERADAAPPAPTSPTESTDFVPAPQKRRQLTVSEASLAYFSDHPDATGEAFVAMQHDANKAEALLYVGDHAMVNGYVEDALAWYEESIAVLNQQTTYNPAIKEAIEMVLELTHSVLDVQLAHVMAREAALKAALDDKIMQWGLKKTQYDPSVLATDETAARAVYQAGEDEYVEKGRANKQNGRGPSAKTKERRRLTANRAAIEYCLEKTELLIVEVNPPVVLKEQDFPSLTQNKATLYQPSTKADKSDKTPVARKKKR